MEENLISCWSDKMQSEFKQPYYAQLCAFVVDQYATTACYPKKEAVFAAFNMCPFSDVKVVLIGQDPYHGEGQANGLSFSVNDGVKHPPSLVNIFKELNDDIGKEIPVSGNLEAWAKQGVLLLNATLTVQASVAGSHQKKGWETFTDAVIKTISAEKEHVVFLLWGGFAKKKAKLIDKKKHTILSTGHPSPLSANRGYWFGNKCFSETNAVLKQKGEQEINW